ncbi:hypothetical protein [uncultured Draconibacterium sp.]|uniref:hypothetical protein n=1 Tax=uncultured Draconibacterium sp. TaxID=1573823 RepID=UPI0029C843F6|nr:hypothetical protein [uncultured Draconibacterium sp.]
MPSIKSITPFTSGSYYHIFNRGINGQNIFFKTNNYQFLLTLLKRHLTAYVDILAYCLLPNHFHLIIKVKEPIHEKEAETNKIVSNQFRKMFISYSMAINKQEGRTGSLFNRPFKRLEITEQDYLEYAIFYVHFNPEKHGIVTDFKTFKNSSFIALCSKNPTALKRDLVHEIYGSKLDFENYHKGMHYERQAIIIE